MSEEERSGWVRPGERATVRRLEDLARRAERTSQAVLTDFLTPREQHLTQSVAGSVGVAVTFYGGYPQAERKRALLAPDWWEAEASDFRMQALVMNPLTGVRHGQVLGALLGTGIERRKVGDVSVSDDGIQVIVDVDLVGYLLAHWRRVGKHPVSLVTVPPEDLVWAAPAYRWAWVHVASPRVDAMVAAACHWPRAKAKEWVERGQVTLNFTELDKPDEEVAEGDVISVRGFGRIAVGEPDGQTQRGRERWRLGILRS
ncbi:RNA-binding protein [Alicyclobacillus kakegawensis]|uniref:YlmH family RNA-binding protein n=1 Tax=Alicyclobacillus kakegawensis TaxID=392012 RepID=UPI00082BCA6F|nr:YlmH/Sll1252 family protein [Alicyclobacillus kakegawensis]